MTTKDRKEKERKKGKAEMEELKEKLELIAGDAAAMADCPEHSFEEDREFLDALEKGEEEDSLFEGLTDAGIQLPAPDEMDDAALSAKLWEVIRGLEELGAYLHNTDHLSDRELYDRLWREVLPEPTVLIPENSCYSCHIDLTGTGSEEDIEHYLRYYADEGTRADWAKEWPDMKMPPHEPLPYDRDRHLPGAWE